MKIYPVFLENAGCSDRCIFCSQKSSAPADALDPKGVRARIEEMLPAQGEGEVAYYGGSFTRLPLTFQGELLGFAAEMVADGRVGGVRVSTRPDALEAETVAFLKGAGVTTVEIGCQSFSPSVLAACNRNYPVAAIAEALGRLKGCGIAVGLQLMPGLPGGDGAEALDSLGRALALRPDFLRIYPAVVLRDTPLERLWRQKRYRPWSLPRTVRVGAQMVALAHREGVPVVRFGLQADKALDRGLVVGPYHPALGQMVKSRLWFESMRRQDFSQAGEFVVHRSDFSDAVGYRRRNLRHLARLGRAVIVQDRTVPRGCFMWRNQLVKVPGLSPAGAV